MQNAALTRLFAIGSVLGPAMAERLAEEGLTSARAEVVWRLHHGGPMTQRQLSEILECTPRNVTGLVDALEDSGFVERRPHPTDRRAIHVTLTRDGEKAARAWTTQSRDLARRLFYDIAADDLHLFNETLDSVLARLGGSMGEGNIAGTEAS